MKNTARQHSVYQDDKAQTLEEDGDTNPHRRFGNTSPTGLAARAGVIVTRMTEC